MSKREREIKVRPVRKQRPDVLAIARVIIELALAESKRETEAAGADTSNASQAVEKSA